MFGSSDLKRNKIVLLSSFGIFLMTSMNKSTILPTTAILPRAAGKSVVELKHCFNVDENAPDTIRSLLGHLDGHSLLHLRLFA